MDDWFYELLANVHTTYLEYEYRLYYDADGSLVQYEMAEVNSPATLDLNYIVVDKETYDKGLYVGEVVDGKLELQQQVKQRKLVPSTTGTPCHASNIMLVDTNSKTFWALKDYYED